MPPCEECGTSQSKLNQGRWCKTCFSAHNVDNHSTGETSAVEQNVSIAGIQLSDINQLPDLSTNSLDQPITTGIMLKIIADVIKPIHVKLEEHEKRITALEENNVSTTNTITRVEKDVKDTMHKLSVSETKIRNLETHNEKLKSVVTKQQNKIAIQDKSVRLKNVVIAGLSETEPLQAATTDMEKCC